jgi:hypothetical protein
LEPTDGSPRTQLGLALIRPIIDQTKKILRDLGEAGLLKMVDDARRSVTWPSDGWVYAHWFKHGANLPTPADYVAWAQAVKQSERTEVWAFIHLATRSPGLAFVNHEMNAVVWYDLAKNANVSVFHPAEGTRQFLAGKDIDYWRLKEVEV